MLFATDPITQLLRSPFGLSSFRPYQEAVCRAVAAGRDVLLVMPTGAGKSLCYQLPGLALDGTTLVISPLIALMEDQVAKLAELGLRAERIHSGRDRAESRQVCRDYLDGRLDFLFIAPERLAVPGFPEMLARRRPVLVAVDEAHCISQWGHDFRPDYRLLGERLPLLRPAPVIGLTATATPRVQDDIAEQLGLVQGKRFIHGFRRTNIAVEAVELAPALRPAAVQRVLARTDRRPAIVYARTRKEAEELAATLAQDLRAAAYHAGMTAAIREQVQTAFLAGDLEVIVATIAFGMGIDKANVRTVIHTGLPGSLEGYYQEIGRAGRDGEPARAVLLYSWADRRNHEYFQNRDYPEVEVLDAAFRLLGATPKPMETLRAALQLDSEVLEKALDKLWTYGGARIDPDGNVTRGDAAWRQPYLAQREHKTLQLDLVYRFAEAHGCRMLHLVRHFGDQEDRGERCGLCDVCAPESCEVRLLRPAQPQEARRLRGILDALAERDGLSTGQLFRQLGGDSGELERKAFERLLGALVREELVSLAADSFVKDGREITFQRAYLTPEALRGGSGVVDRLRLPEEMASPAKKRGAKASRTAAPGTEVEPAAALVEALKAWRLGEARRTRLPAFRILTDRTLLALAALKPRDEASLLAVPGIGPTIVTKHGAEILRIVREAG